MINNVGNKPTFVTVKRSKVLGITLSSVHLRLEPGKISINSKENIVMLSEDVKELAGKNNVMP